MRLWIKRVGLVCLIPSFLVLLLSILLYFPPFQNFAVRKAVELTERESGMRIGIKKIRLSFPLDLTVEGVEAINPPSDTILTLESLKLRIQALPLLKKQVLIEAIDINRAIFNSYSMINGLEAKGMLGHFHLHADRVDLGKERARLNKIDLSDTALTLILNDSTADDETTSNPINWVLQLDKININRVAIALQIPSDSLRISSFIDMAEMRSGLADLGNEDYKINNIGLNRSSIYYDSNYSTPTSGMDPSHIHLTDLNASIDSIRYKDKDIKASIKELMAEERSGLKITKLIANLNSDNEKIELPKVTFETENSQANISASIPWGSIEDDPKEIMSVALDASIGKGDILLAAGNLPDDFKMAYPNSPISINSKIEGNSSAMRIVQGDLLLPKALSAKVAGRMESITDSIKRSGELNIIVKSGELDFILSMLPPSERENYVIPQNMELKGEATLSNREYKATLMLTEDRGKIDMTAQFNPITTSYKASLSIDSLEPIHFMPKDSLYWVSANIEAEGKGDDIFSPKTWSRIHGKVSDIKYGKSSVSDITIDGSLDKNMLKADIVSKYPLAELDLSLNASVKKNDVKAMLIADVSKMDLYGLHLVPNPLSTSFQLFAEAESDLNEDNSLDVSLGNWELTTEEQSFRPKMLTLHSKTNIDTTMVSFHAGDFGIVLTGKDCIHHISDKLTKLSKEITVQMERDSTVNLEALRPILPDIDLEVRVGQDNPIYNYMQLYYLDFKNISMNAYSSPERGIGMNAEMLELGMDTMQIDTIRAEITQDTLGLIYSANVIKNRYRKQQPFSAGLEGQLRYGFGDARLYLKDGNGDIGLLLGIRADKVENGVSLHLFPENPILAFKRFKLNPDNFITMRNELKDIDANLRLSGDNNAALWIHSPAYEEGMPEEVHAELSQIDLGVISKSSSYLPSMNGVFNADLQYAPSDSSFMVVADMNIDNLYYEGERVGELLLNAVYLPLELGQHQIDVHFARDREEVGTMTALYQEGKVDNINGNLTLTRFPLDIANAFIPEDMAKMSGFMDGSLDINGRSDHPVADGSFSLDTASVFVGALGSSFKFDNKRIKIENNRIIFDKFGIYAYNKNPFLINGDINFDNPSNMMADLSLTANNLQLINVKRNDESLVYGKLFANLNAKVRGPLESLTTRGDLQLLGGTNITYVLKDSPLAVQDRMSGLVTFTSFADTLRRKRPRKPPLPMGGMDMLMTIRVDPAVQANVDLSADQSNHINLEGGGDLSFQYTPQGDMFLNGRYTLSGGKVKYSIPVIPLKEFNIKEGSYVQWTGDPMDPTLNLTATERVRTSVTPAGQSSPRPVNFDVGIELTQKLENLGLQFTLEAPEDMAMQEELTSKGAEERAKLAVSMLVTGMYLSGSGGKVNMNMGNALSSFLQSEINNIAGSALKTVDISFGMNTYDGNGNAGGGTRTDYSFRFAKRFYNDRIRVILGGRISTGADINNGQAQPFIDNISVEYRLDNSGSRYVKLFHDKNYESLLEGEIIETGGGIVLRRKMMRLKELFNFKKTKVKPIDENKE